MQLYANQYRSHGLREIKLVPLQIMSLKFSVLCVSWYRALYRFQFQQFRKERVIFSRDENLKNPTLFQYSSGCNRSLRFNLPLKHLLPDFNLAQLWIFPIRQIHEGSDSLCNFPLTAENWSSQDPFSSPLWHSSEIPEIQPLSNSLSPPIQGPFSNGIFHSFSEDTASFIDPVRWLPFTGRIWEACTRPDAGSSAAPDTTIRCKRTKTRMPTCWRNEKIAVRSTSKCSGALLVTVVDRPSCSATRDRSSRSRARLLFPRRRVAFVGEIAQSTPRAVSTWTERPSRDSSRSRCRVRA